MDEAGHWAGPQGPGYPGQCVYQASGSYFYRVLPPFLVSMLFSS